MILDSTLGSGKIYKYYMEQRKSKQEQHKRKKRKKLSHEGNRELGDILYISRKM